MISFIEIVFIIIIIICLIWVFRPLFETFEGFDNTGNVFVPVGYPRYGLRGDRLRRSDISKYYISPRRNIRLNHSNNVIWESNLSPIKENICGCGKAECPLNNNEFDNLDTCWKCGSDQPEPMIIPPIHPHVKN